MRGADEGRQRMLETNVRQHDFYESRFESTASATAAPERAANRPTQLWTKLRRRIQSLRAKVGGDDQLISLHRAWLGDLRSARVLDLGCFAGNRLSLWIAENSKEYIGVDLSEQAIARLQADLDERKVANASAKAMDFLANDWPDHYFDRVYAYSVLHHFADLDVALRELRRVVKPGGIVVSMDPLATEPFNRLARALYRPVQTDRDWEFPFTKKSLEMIGRHFHIREQRGIQGVVKLAYPLLVFSTTERVGQRFARRLLEYDSRSGPLAFPLFSPWHLALKLERPQDGAMQ